MAKESINFPKAPAPVGPYNRAVRCGDTRYVSNQIAPDPDTGILLKAFIAQETQWVMQYFETLLQAVVITVKGVVKYSIFIQKMNDFGTINEVYTRFFDLKTAPARETVEVNQLPKDARVEISCTISQA